MIPFFVADRPMSLRLLASSFSRAPAIELGLLAHAHVTNEFVRMFADFPSGSLDEEHPPEFPVSVRRIGDSGIFMGRLSYSDLFRRYSAMNVDYGIMADVLGDPEATLVSAREAVKTYRKERRSFELVLVAQGRTTAEYLRSYAALRKLGGFKIALGGLLRRRRASVRYLYVGDEKQMISVLTRVRDEFQPDWLFPLGAYHPKRHSALSQLGVYGSDYKGWIFQYVHKRDAVQREVEAALSSTEMPFGLRQLLERRRVLAAQEAAARRAYALQKNGDAQACRRKHNKRAAWESAQRILTVLDDDIVHSVMQSSRSRKLLAPVRAAIGRSERAWRFAGVHDYLSRRVYSQCVGVQQWAESQ